MDVGHEIQYDLLQIIPRFENHNLKRYLTPEYFVNQTSRISSNWESFKDTWLALAAVNEAKGRPWRAAATAPW